jgi:hypothetical protein
MDTQLNALPALPVLVSSVRTPEDRFAFDSNRFSVGGGVPDSLKPGRAGPSAEIAGRSRRLQISSARVLRRPMPILDRRERAVHRAVKKQAGREGPAW